MNTPNYFLADLPPEALTPMMVSEACIAIKRNRAQFLLKRNTSSLIRTIVAVADEWQDDRNPFRQRALNEGPGEIGFSKEVIARGLDDFFGQITKRNLEDLIIQDLGHVNRLDEMTATETEHGGERASRAIGSELLVHVAGGALPNPTLLSMILGLLVRSAQFVKCPSGGALIPRLVAHSIYAIDPKVGACLELGAWAGGNAQNAPMEDALFSHATCVTATGSDETLAAVRSRLAGQVRFVGYGHRISFAYVTAEMLSAFTLPKIVSKAADDIASWDQLGCLSPHAIYVETGGAIGPEKFAELLAAELAKREATHPRGELSFDEHSSIARRRGFYEVRASHSAETRCWFSPESTAWSVVFEADPEFHASSLNRFIYVRPVIGFDQLLLAIDKLRGKVSTVGVAAAGASGARIANQLAEWGVTRICPIGQMQNPPLRWRHDGRPALGELVTWTDWEMQF
jgi:hypothetical protein